MELDQDVRDILFAIHSILKRLSIVARSPNLEALRDLVELALSQSNIRTWPLTSGSATLSDISILREVADIANETNAYRH